MQKITRFQAAAGFACGKRRRLKSTDNLDELLDPDQLNFNEQFVSQLPSPVPVPPAAASSQDEHGGPAGAERKPLLVMKFGGSSLASVEHLQRVAGIVSQHLPSRPVVVLSAMGKTTNNLLGAADRALQAGAVDTSRVRETHEGVFRAMAAPVPQGVAALLEELERILSGIALLKEISERTRDLVVSFGERLSVRVFEAVFNGRHSSSVESAAHGERPLRARALDSWEVGMQTSSGVGSSSSAFTQVEVLESSYGSIASHLAPLEVDYTYLPVVTGYIAQDSKGTITTLGRDGSDLSATVIGAAVHACEVQIWKDVSGILTVDPRIVPSAKPIQVLTYEEAAELSTFGANVVHPSAVMPAWLAKVPISVRSSLAPDLPGTRIVASLGEARASQVVAMSSKDSITMIIIRSTRMLGQHGFLAHLFSTFDKFEMSVDVISTSEITVSLTLDKGFKSVDLFSLRRELEEVATVDVREGMAMITLITAKTDSCTVLRQSFEVFEALGIQAEMVSHGASNVNVTFVLPSSSLALGTRKLHDTFFGI